ncbi:MAG: T9SS type A sorting domain-containing protein, partial [Saprospiraceae bacterium]|nr:T9SS type A sorting domain-containing protein [Saprospiraceae bacterium]
LYGDAYFGDGLIADDICVPSYPMPVPPMGEDDPCKGYDVYFSQLTELSGIPDVYPDILIGRIPADDLIQVTNASTKICNYEPIDVSSPNYDGWKDRYAFINHTFYTAGDQFYYEVLTNYLPSSATTSLLTNHIPVEEYYPDSYYLFSDIQDGDPDDLLAEIIEGNIFVTYIGHGEYYKWSIENGDWSYQNIQYNNQVEGRLPILISGCCDSGNFQSYDDEFTEKMLCASSIKGCIAHIGAVEGAHSPEVLDKYLFKANDRSLTSVGEMLLYAKLNVTGVNSIESRNIMNLYSDPALNIYLDTENVVCGDLYCSPDNISAEYMNNQTLCVTAGITNLCQLTYLYDVSVRCTLYDNFTSERYHENARINGIGYMETEDAVFYFDVSTKYPTNYRIGIFIDPQNLINERNENNNITSKLYEFYKESNDYPVVIEEEGYEQNSSALFWDNSILISGKRYDSEGDLIWNYDNDCMCTFMPLYSESSHQYNYIIINDESGEHDICLIDGSDGSLIESYDVPEGCRIGTYATGDVNNDGVDEIIIASSAIPEFDLLIFDENLDLINTIETNGLPIQDIAIGDSDNNGINEIFVLYCFGWNNFKKYEFDNNSYEIISEVMLNYPTLLNLNLMDYNEDGEFDCVIFENEHILVTQAKDDEVNEYSFGDDIITPINLDYLDRSLVSSAIGDIDNNRAAEVVFILDDGSVNFIDSGEINNLFTISPDIVELDGWCQGLTLYDLDGDSELDIVFDDGETIMGFAINGDPLFRYPKESTISNNLISDIDDDDDIDFIFSIKKDNYDNDPMSVLMVSDLHNNVSTHGNLYPKMNEFRTNLYSQTVNGTLSSDTDYYWSGTISLIGAVNLPSTSSLTIQPGTVIKAKANSKLTCLGDLTVNGTENHPVIFEPDVDDASQNYWQGLELTYNISEIVMKNIVVKNAYVYSKRDIEITNGSFINTPFFEDGKDLHFTNVEFDNSPITAEFYNTPSLETLYLDGCHLYNSPYAAGLEVTGYVNVKLVDNIIENCESGVMLWESGSGESNTISNNIIRNNTTDYGLFAYHSDIDIAGNNVIENNRIGLCIVNKSNFDLEGRSSEPYQIISDNSEGEVIFHYDSRPGQFYHNNIYDDNHDYCYVKCEQLPPSVSPIYIDNNYWGTSFYSKTDISPYDLFIYLPIWDPEGRGMTEYGSDEEMYISAQELIDNESYGDAELAFMEIISVYPESKFAKIAAKKLLPLRVKSDQNFTELKQYYETEPNMQYDEEMTDLSDYLITHCNIRIEEYGEAIDWFEDIIQNPPTIVDSVFAVIDAGYTYMVMENTGRSDYLGQVKELKPKSSKQYSVIRSNLLKQLFRNNEPDNEIPEITEAALYSNYPNPFNPTTTISFALPAESEVSISIYNIKGQKVKTLINEVYEKGQHKIIWDGLNASGKQAASGVYLYNMQTKDYSSTKKMLMIK